MARGSAEDAPRRIAMFIYPGVTPLDVTGPLEVFSVCNYLKERQCYEVVTVAPTADPVPTPIGVTFLPTMAMEDLEVPVDTLLVSGTNNPDAGITPETLAWLRQATPQARRFGSVCTGAFLLAAAGLLDGRRAVTHWAFSEVFAERHPDVNLEIDPIFIRDGNLYTSAGITSGIDLGLALLEEDHGREFALNVARALVVFLQRSGGQAQFSMQLRAQLSSVPNIQRVQEWCLDNLDREFNIAMLARRAAMSERNFQRLFRKETGQTPLAFIASARLQAACRMLEETRLGQQGIAKRCGFRTVAAMRRVFMRILGVAPGQYREKFNPELAHRGVAAPVIVERRPSQHLDA